MQTEDEEFNNHKKNALVKLEDAMKSHKVDTLVIPLLEKINSTSDYFTTSSCAGRIVVLQLPEIGNKKKAVFLGRWHRTVNVEEVSEALDSYNEGQVWLLTQPPIFHIGCKNIVAANELMKIGISNGFKHSGIRSISSQITVELQSTERMDIPLGSKNTLVIEKEIIPFFVDMANTSITRAQDKLTRLQKHIEEKLN
ncbi:MAG: hypothetical protein KGY65_07930 [Candidatus Thermoplasmatota archaeon]|nr:hypothetical protein [Candidatus Thermoplasmatota archaeon]MBS3802663.1 hypothetical protein [Candidatus Thermoplasmatota archaeon]